LDRDRDRKKERKKDWLIAWWQSLKMRMSQKLGGPIKTHEISSPKIDLLVGLLACLAAPTSSSIAQ